ncbi:DMT family transporter [Bacillus sp. 165]|uniref:DMT family transporter n=1 Tax=Bacillus sp. 165 TaxID=1529117 RepID=UPI001ADCF7C4|nr:DMT family transporter [Bacillus sp. 165]MBO9128183.1 DMT family transporter [Bacillus sp. 165]
MKKKWVANVSLLFVAFIWGVTFVIVQNAISLVPPFTFNAIRFFLAGVILLIIERMLKGKSTSAYKKSLLPGAVVGCFLFGGYLFQTFGLLYTTSSKAGFLTGLSVVLIPVFSFIFLKQKTGMFAIIGVAIATLGLFLLTTESGFSLNRGDALVLCCAVSFAIHILLNGTYSKQYSVLHLTTIQILTVAALSAGCAVFFEDWSVLLSAALWRNASFVFSLFITAVLATALAFFIQTAAQTLISPTRVAIIFAMEPVFAAVAGILFASERLSVAAAVGGVCIFLGMILAELPNKPVKKETQAA